MFLYQDNAISWKWSKNWLSVLSNFELLIPVAFEVLEEELLSILSGFQQDQYQIQPKHTKYNYLYFSSNTSQELRVENCMVRLLELNIKQKKSDNRVSSDPNLPQSKKHTSWGQNHSIQNNFMWAKIFGNSFYCLHFGFNLKDITYRYVNKTSNSHA